MTERWGPAPEEPEHRAERPRAVHCWACEEVLAFQTRRGIILDADAEQVMAGDQRIITCGACGERTILPLTAAPAERGTRDPGTQEDGSVKTVDGRYEYRGTWREGGFCRLRIYERGDEPPVIIISEDPDNENTSVTNMAEVLAAEVIAKHFPARFEYDVPAIVLEHYPTLEDPHRRVIAKFEYDQVTFQSWTPRKIWLGGVERVALGEPAWKPLDPERLASLVGVSLAQNILAEDTRQDQQP